MSEVPEKMARPMRRRSIARLCALALGLGLSALAGLAAAQPPPAISRTPPAEHYVIPAAELQRLYERLDATEQRVRELEIRRLPPVAIPQEEASTGEGSNEQIQHSGDNGAKDDEDDASLAERIKALEEKLEKQAEADAAQETTQRWTGRIHADYWGFPGNSPGANAFETGDPFDSIDHRFLFRRVRMGIQGEIQDNMIYKLEVDFNNPNSPQYKDLYFGWEELPVLQTVLIGNQKRPYCLDHINSSRFTVFMERPFVIEALNQDSRRFGIMSYGKTDDLAYNWRYGALLMQDMQAVGTIFTDPVTEDFQAEIAGRLANTIWYDEASDGRGHAHWAIAGTFAHPSGRDFDESTAHFQTRPEARTSSRWIDTGVLVGTDTYEIIGLEGLVNLGPLQVVGEYMNAWVQRGGRSDLRFDGGYVYVAYFLTGEHMVWDRETGQLGRVKPLENFWLVDTCNDGVAAGWGAWQLAVRYSTADFCDDDILGGMGNSITVGLNWHWNAHARMQLNYVYGDIRNRRPDDRAPVDTETAATYHIIGTRFMVDF